MKTKTEYKGVYTKLDEETYEKIKERGYKIAELIKIGLEAKEVQESFVSFTLKVAERLESTAKIQEQIAETHKRLLSQQESIIASLNSVTTRLDLISSSLNSTVNKFEKLIERQEELINTLVKRFDGLIDKINELIENNIEKFEKENKELSEKMRLSLNAIRELTPKDKFELIVQAIANKDEKLLKKILKNDQILSRSLS